MRNFTRETTTVFGQFANKKYLNFADLTRLVQMSIKEPNWQKIYSEHISTNI